MTFQKKKWVAQRVGWAAMLAFLVAAVCGLFGSGLVSAGRVRQQQLGITYPRTDRAKHPTNVVIRAPAGPDGKARVWIDTDDLRAFEIKQVVPSPRRPPRSMGTPNAPSTCSPRTGTPSRSRTTSSSPGRASSAGASGAGKTPSSSPPSFPRAAILCLFLLVRFPVRRKRTLAQFTAFDAILILIISETTQQALIAGDDSFTGALILIETLDAIDVGFGVLKQRPKRVEQLVNSVPLLMLENGRPIKDRLHKERVDEHDVLNEARRAHGPERFDQVKYATLECDGAISIIPARQ